MYIDLATTRYNMNRIKNHRLNNEVLPAGVARDGDYQLTTNPKEAKTLEPIGGHKGFALAFLVEILTSGLMSRDPSLKLNQCMNQIYQKRTLTPVLLRSTQKFCRQFIRSLESNFRS